MHKKYLFYIVSLIMLSLLFLARWSMADSHKIWLIKSKTDPVYTLWLDGTITVGEPDTTTEVIALSANEYVAASRWFIRGNAIYTPWRKKPIIYSFESKKSSCRVGLSVKNYAGGQGWTKPSGYSHFHVRIYLDDNYKGTLSVAASDTQVNTDYLDIKQLDKGKHEVKFIWTNDRYKPGKKQDANIEIHNVLIEQTY